MDEKLPVPFTAIEAGMKVINQSELNRLVEQIAALRKALEPFAHFGDALPPIIEGQPRLTDYGPMLNAGPLGSERQLTFAHVRHAKALFEQLLAEDSTRILAATERTLCDAPENCHACLGQIYLADELALKGFCSQQCLDIYEKNRLAQTELAALLMERDELRKKATADANLTSHGM